MPRFEATTLSKCSTLSAPLAVMMSLASLDTFGIGEKTGTFDETNLLASVRSLFLAWHVGPKPDDIPLTTFLDVAILDHVGGSCSSLFSASVASLWQLYQSYRLGASGLFCKPTVFIQ